MSSIEAPDSETMKREYLKKYNRDYYHAHKKESDCQHCSKTFSSVSAMRRHQKRNTKCLLIQARRELEQSRGGKKVAQS
jgi:hypothetical protein